MIDQKNLKTDGLYKNGKEEITAPEAYKFLAGFPLTVRMAETNQAAGSIELFAAGGLLRPQLQKIADVILADALPIRLANWCKTYIPPRQLPHDWSRECLQLQEQWNGITVHSESF